MGGSIGVFTDGPVDPGNASAGNCHSGKCSGGATVGTLYDSQGTTTAAGVPIPGPVPYFNPVWADDPAMMSWANVAGRGQQNFIFGMGMPITSLLDMASALFTPACVVEGQCLTDEYRAWGKSAGLVPTRILRASGRRSEPSEEEPRANCPCKKKSR